MKEKIRISGFADEISADFDVQLKTVTDLGMHYISLRSADGIGVADYTPDLVKEKLLPRLKAAGVGVSSLGSPIGKVDIKDEAGFQKQLAQLRTLCEIAHRSTAATSGCSASTCPRTRTPPTTAPR